VQFARVPTSYYIMGKFHNITPVIFIKHPFFSYPSRFIENEFNKFFYEYKSTSPFLPFIDDEKQFNLMRHKLLGEPTSRRSQLQQSSATADMDNDQTDEQNNNDTTTTTTTKHNVDKLFVHYTHEKRFEPFKRDMHHQYDDIFGHTPAMEAKLIVGTRNRRNATNELIRKRPKKTLLRDIFTQRKYS
jgi:hypothetical protein